jgi:alkylation response protein AidB-like acyl-CoA dehydrogenase
MTLVVSPGLCAPLLAKFGTPDQRATWLFGIGSAPRDCPFAMTEADAGSNSHCLRTRGTRTDGGWRLSGEKAFISAVDQAAAEVLIARHGEASQRAGADDEGFSMFIVETDRPGLSISPIPIPMHVLAAEQQFVVTLDGLYVPDANLVGDAGRGLRHPFVGLNPERIVSAATCVGIGSCCLDAAVNYATQRSVWNVPIGVLQSVAHPLAETHVALESARLMPSYALSVRASGTRDGAAANMAKLTASDALSRAFDVALHVHGGNGLSQAYALSHLWGLLKMYRIAPVSREMTLNPHRRAPTRAAQKLLMTKVATPDE